MNKIERFQLSRRDGCIRRLITRLPIGVIQRAKWAEWWTEEGERAARLLPRLPLGSLRSPLTFGLFSHCEAWAGPRLSLVNFNQSNWNSWWEVLLLKPTFFVIMSKKRQAVIFAVLGYSHERQLMFYFLKTCFHWQGEQMTKKDERLKLINEVLKGMKVWLLSYFCFWLFVSLSIAYVLTPLSFALWPKNQRCTSYFLHKLFLFES